MPLHERNHRPLEKNNAPQTEVTIRKRIALIIAAGLLGLSAIAPAHAQEHAEPDGQLPTGLPTELAEIDEDDVVSATNDLAVSPTFVPTRRSTATPETPPPTPEQIEITLTVLQGVNVRPTSNTTSRALMTLSAGSNVRVLDRDEQGERVNGNSVWYLVQLGDKRTGWVWSGAVRLDGEFPVSANTPTPISTPENTQTPTLTPNMTATPTPERTSTLSSTPSEITATPSETENATGDGFVTFEELEAFPQTIRYTFQGLSPDGVIPGPRTPVSVELDLENVSTLRGIDGQLIPFGFYVGEQPPIDPELFTERLWVGSTEIEYGYVSGILTHIEVDAFGGVLLGLSVPIETTGQYATLHISLGGNGQKVALLDEFGTQTRSITDSMPIGTNNPNYPGAREGNGIYFSSERQRFTYPTASGSGQIRVGQQILVRFLVNDRQLSLEPGGRVVRSQVIGSGDRSATEVIADLTDTRRGNDSRVVWQSEGLILPEAGIPSGT